MGMLTPREVLEPMPPYAPGGHIVGTNRGHEIEIGRENAPTRIA
jgi:hypothetical protein